MTVYADKSRTGGGVATLVGTTANAVARFPDAGEGISEGGNYDNEDGTHPQLAAMSWTMATSTTMTSILILDSMLRNLGVRDQIYKAELRWIEVSQWMPVR